MLNNPFTDKEETLSNRDVVLPTNAVNNRQNMLGTRKVKENGNSITLIFQIKLIVEISLTYNEKRGHGECNTYKAL